MADRGDNPIYEGDTGKRDMDTFMDTITLGLAGTRGQSAREAASRRLGGIQLPEYSRGQYVSPEYAGDMTPDQLSDPVAAQYKTVLEDPRTRGLQMQALQRLQQYGDQAADSQEALGRYNAVSDANALAAQREAAVRNQMQMRGQGGSAAEFALQQQAGQEGANRAQAGGMNAAMQAALQRLQGTNAAFGAAGQLRGQDFQNQAYNNDVINAFNMRNTDALNAARHANVGIRNAAQSRNLGARQESLNQGADASNQNLSRSDANANTRFGQQLQKEGAVGSAMSGQAAGFDKQSEGWQKLAQTAAKFYSGGTG